MQPQVEVLQSDDTRLVLRYSVTNDWGREIFLFNRLFVTDRTGKRTVDPNHVYVSVDGTTLLLGKTLIFVPEEKEVEHPEVPYMTRLESGESFEEVIELKPPVREHNPYRRTDIEKAADHVVECQELVLILGYFTPPEASWVREVDQGGNTELATSYGLAVQAFDSVVSAPVAVRCGCIVVSHATE